MFAAKRTTVEQVESIFFDGQCRWSRYFLANTRQGVEGESPGTEDLSQETDNETMTPTISPYERVRCTLQAAPPRERHPGAPVTEDIVPLPDNTDCDAGWYLEKTPNRRDDSRVVLDCLIQCYK